MHEKHFDLLDLHYVALRFAFQCQAPRCLRSAAVQGFIGRVAECWTWRFARGLEPRSDLVNKQKLSGYAKLEIFVIYIG